VPAVVEFKVLFNTPRFTDDFTPSIFKESKLQQLVTLFELVLVTGIG
jgi:hypothetical protein